MYDKINSNRNDIRMNIPMWNVENIGNTEEKTITFKPSISAAPAQKRLYRCYGGRQKTESWNYG